MTAERVHSIDQRTREALAELQGAIAEKYPTTRFEVRRAEDDPSAIHLVAVSDVDDLDEVGDLVLDRVIELQVDEGLPIHVIPVPTPERVAADVAAQRQRKGWWIERTIPLHEALGQGGADRQQT